MTNKLIVLELNEVPYRVLDTYCRERPGSTLARILPVCRQYATKTEDKLALDPWISWATLHRGVHDEVHGILHLGQEIQETDAKFPPIWQILRQRNLKVGVFGSLHSGNVPSDVSNYSFYVPDYFEAVAFAHPKSLVPFQELNLLLTRQSARNVARQLPVGAVAKFLTGAPSLGLRLATLADALSHLARETLDPGLRVRRRSYQPLFMADLFIKQLDRTKPDIATFYTNHVAAAMHRYWGARFPEDYVSPLDQEWIRRYADEITFAMEKFDVILRRFVSFVERNPEYKLLVASSMGQAAIPANKTYGFLTITSLARFMAALGVPAGKWQARPAMVPCQCAVVDPAYRDLVVRSLEGFSLAERRFQRDKRPLAPMSYDERENGFFQFFVQFDNYDGAQTATVNDRTISLSELGMGIMAHEDGVNCTAQHVAEGSLFVFDAQSQGERSAPRIPISTLDVVPSIMRMFGIPQATYMPGAARIAL